MRCLELARRLNDELGFRDGRLRFATRPTGADVFKLFLDSSVRGNLSWPAGCVCELYLSGSYPVSMYLAYGETWARSSRTRYRFESSNLRFVIALDNDSRTLPLRLEWTGLQDNGFGRLEFPGKGAAHPHWHIDLHELMRYELGIREVAVDVGQRDAIEKIDLYATSVEPAVSVDRTVALNWLHRVHLPARAMWHERPYVDQYDAEGHQHKPVTLDEVDNWILSAIRYLHNEFEAHA